MNGAPWFRTGKAVAAVAMLALLGLPAGVIAQELDQIWDLEAVDMDGNGVHPSLGYRDDEPEAWVTFRGVVLNEPNDMLDTATQWQMYVQALPGTPDPNNRGGIAVYANAFYYKPVNYWPRYSADFAPGDVVEVHGLMMNYNGKANLNERHWPGEENHFTITKISAGAVPAPLLIPSIAACNTFDTTDADGDGLPDRDAGGERYQAQWCRLEGLRVTNASGWGNGSAVPVTDDSAETLTMFCGYMGDFDVYTAPGGKFNVTAIFDQEDDSGVPYHGNYRMWPLKFSQVEMWGDTNLDSDVDLADVGSLLGNWTGAGSPQGKAWADGDFDKDEDVDLEDVGNLLANWTGSRDDLGAPAGEGPLPAGAWAEATYDPQTGEIVVSAADVQYLKIDGAGLLTGDDPDWSFLTGGLPDSCRDFSGFFAYGSAQTFADQSIGCVAATDLAYGDLRLTYMGDVGTGLVTVPVVPEPAGLALLAVGAAGLVRRRKRRLS